MRRKLFYGLGILDLFILVVSINVFTLIYAINKCVNITALVIVSLSIILFNIIFFILIYFNQKRKA